MSNAGPLLPEGALPEGAVCILLPVLNEIGNIDELLRGIERVLPSKRCSICIVDDGSTDGTVEYLERRRKSSAARLHVITRRKTGRGSQRGSALHVSLLWGLNYPEHAIFVEMDGDLSHRPEELPIGIDLIARDRCDVAVASKYLPGSAVTNRPLGRRAVSRLCNLLVRALLSWRVRDYSNGFRFYNRAAAEAITATEIRYGSPIYLTEAMSIWLAGGFRIAEFATTYVGRNEGLSKLRLTDLLKAGVGVFEIAARRHLFGFKPAPAASLSPAGELAVDVRDLPIA